MKFYSFMSGTGFEGGAYGMPWIKAWVFMGILTILVILAKRWLGEEGALGVDWNWLGGVIGLLIYFLFVSITGWTSVGFLVGLAAVFGGGVLLAKFSGGSAC